MVLVMLWSCRLLNTYSKGLLCVLVVSDNECFSLCVCKHNTGDKAVEVAHHAADTNTALQPTLELFCQ